MYALWDIIKRNRSLVKVLTKTLCCFGKKKLCNTVCKCLLIGTIPAIYHLFKHAQINFTSIIIIIATHRRSRLLKLKPPSILFMDQTAVISLQTPCWRIAFFILSRNETSIFLTHTWQSTPSTIMMQRYQPSNTHKHALHSIAFFSHKPCPSWKLEKKKIKRWQLSHSWRNFPRIKKDFSPPSHQLRGSLFIQKKGKCRGQV